MTKAETEIFHRMNCTTFESVVAVILFDYFMDTHHRENKNIVLLVAKFYLLARARLFHQSYYYVQGNYFRQDMYS